MLGLLLEERQRCGARAQQVMWGKEGSLRSWVRVWKWHVAYSLLSTVIFFFFNLNGGGVGGKVAKETGISKKLKNLQRWRKRERKKYCPKRTGHFRAFWKSWRRLLTRSSCDTVRAWSEAVVARRRKVEERVERVWGLLHGHGNFRLGLWCHFL